MEKLFCYVGLATIKNILKITLIDLQQILEDKMEANLVCNKCSYSWISREVLENENFPKQCPRCKSYDWNKKIKVN